MDLPLAPAARSLVGTTANHPGTKMNDSLQNQPTGRALDAPFYVSLGAAFGAILAAGFAYWQATITKDVEWRSLRSYVGVTSPTIHFVENDSV